MRKIILTLLLLNFYANPIFGQFIGKIEMNLESPQGSGEIAFTFGKHAERMDMQITPPQLSSAIKTSMILKHDSPDLAHVLMDATKSYMIIDLKKATAMAGGISVDENYDIQVIGQDKVQGYRCQHVKVTGNATDLELWLSPEILDFETFRRLQSQNPKMSNSALADALKKAGADGFPIRMLQTMNGQKIKMELRKVERKKAIAASVFEIPASYQKIQPQMQMTEEQRKKMRELMQKLQKQNQ